MTKLTATGLDPRSTVLAVVLWLLAGCALWALGRWRHRRSVGRGR